MASDEIVLFDIPTRPPQKAWSFNTFRTRFALNYMKIPYRTEWLEYPEIKPKLLDHFPDHDDTYTVPTVILPDGTWIMDSYKIAPELEARYPASPRLHLDAPVLPRVREHMIGFMVALRGEFVPRVCADILGGASQPFFDASRAADFGMSLERVRRELGGDAAYEAARPHIERVTALLKEEGSGEAGPFFMGRTVSYADFIWAAILVFWKRLGDDAFAKLLEISGDREVHLRFLEAAKPWTERDDY
ncbi:putative glutathione S-transferase [Xylariomycetidae sp. FL2044]|nr:putative glutathione S-transferase [Xylariomycetidae sp. FL2044]